MEKATHSVAQRLVSLFVCLVFLVFVFDGDKYGWRFFLSFFFLFLLVSVLSVPCMPSLCKKTPSRSQSLRVALEAMRASPAQVTSHYMEKRFLNDKKDHVCSLPIDG